MTCCCPVDQLGHRLSLHYTTCQCASTSLQFLQLAPASWQHFCAQCSPPKSIPCRRASSASSDNDLPELSGLRRAAARRRGMAASAAPAETRWQAESELWADGSEAEGPSSSRQPASQARLPEATSRQSAGWSSDAEPEEPNGSRQSPPQARSAAAPVCPAALWSSDTEDAAAEIEPGCPVTDRR